MAIHDAALLSALPIELPRKVMATMMLAMTIARMRAYSAAEAPDRPSLRNLVERHCGITLLNRLTKARSVP